MPFIVVNKAGWQKQPARSSIKFKALYSLFCSKLSYSKTYMCRNDKNAPPPPQAAKISNVIFCFTFDCTEDYFEVQGTYLRKKIIGPEPNSNWTCVCVKLLPMFINGKLMSL